MNRGIIRGVRFALCLFSWLVLAVPAQAASFDCAKAQTKVEHIICGNPEISKLDEELAQSYKAALQDPVQARKVKQAQKQWVKERNGCADEGCVERTYESRLQAISSSENSTLNQKQKPRFRVAEGKGYSVCENYARFLNSLPESEPLPLCHLKRAPDFPDLKDPDWEELDIPSYFELIYSIEKILSPSGHDRPVDTFDHWKAVYEQQIKNGDASPRLRRTHLALLVDAPIETILAYELDRNSCDKDVQKRGYADYGSRIRLFVWNEQDKKVEKDLSWIAFTTLPELMLYQGKPLLFSGYWGDGTYPHLTGGISVHHFISAGVGNQYGHMRRCQIVFDLTQTLIERMTK